MTLGTEAWLFALSLAASAVGGALGMASGIFIRAFYIVALFALAAQMLLAAMGIHLKAGSG